MTTAEAQDRKQRLREMGFVTMDEVEDRPPEFLDVHLRRRFPKRAVTILGGDPGASKSRLMMKISSEISKNAPAVFLSHEDDESALKRQFRKFDAHLPYVHTLPLDRSFMLDPAGYEVLEMALEEWHPAVVTLDTMTSFMGSGRDMHRANEVREPLKELAVLAKRHDTVIVPIIHMNKNDAKMLYKLLGSIDFVGAPRSVLAVGRLDNEPNRGRVLFHIKCAPAKEMEPVGYDLIGDPDDEDEPPALEWRDEPGFTRAEWERQASGGPTKIDQARKVLRSLLADEGRDQRLIRTIADAMEISDQTLERAAKKEAVIKDQNQNNGQHGSESTWRLPPFMFRSREFKAEHSPPDSSADMNVDAVWKD